MKKNGFTLIEVLAVIVIISLLMVLTIPNVFKVANNTKQQAYKTKIELLEAAAKQFGLNNRAFVMKGSNPLNNVNNGIVTLTVDNRDNVTGASLSTKVYNAQENLNSETTHQYRGIQIAVKDLIGTNDIKWDYENQCVGCQNEEYYNNTVVDPTNNYIINGCYIYVYYKYSTVYTYFDRNTCDQRTAQPGYNGKEYSPLKK